MACDNGVRWTVSQTTTGLHILAESEDKSPVAWHVPSGKFHVRREDNIYYSTGVALDEHGYPVWVVADWAKGRFAFAAYYGKGIFPVELECTRKD